MAPRTRTMLMAALLGTSAIFATGCSTDASVREPEVTAGEFPITVEHRFGETTIPSAPQRVAITGPTDSDTVLALGISPQLVSQWIPDWTAGVAPWSESGLGDSRPAIMNYPEIDFEKVAAAEPDVIIAAATQLDESQYEMLSAIAPTVASAPGYGDPYTVPWDVQILHIGAVLGKRQVAQDLVDGMNAELEGIREAHPEWSGSKAATLFNRDGQFGIYAPTDSRGQFMGALGFEMPDNLSAKFTGDWFYEPLSEEQLGVLADLDVLLVLAADEKQRALIEGSSVFANLDPVRENRVVFLDTTDLEMAVSSGTIPAMDYVLATLVARTESALPADGR